MKLTYNSDYLSIKKFTYVELPKLTVLTGLNGAGKSHLLNAIKKGYVKVENIEISNIIEFNNITFSLDNEPKIMLSKIQDERSKMYSYIDEKLKKVPVHHKTNINPIIEKLTDYTIDKDLSFYELTKEDFESLGLQPFFKEYSHYVHYVKQVMNNNGVGERKVYEELLKILKYTPVPLDDMSRTDLDNVHVPLTYKNDFLLTQLGKIFSDYWQKYELNEYNKFRNEKFANSYKVLDESEFILEHGKKPWEVINHILSRFGSLQYNVNNPEGLERGHEFQLNLISTTIPDVIVDFENLSSGERTMMALVSSIYKSIIDKKFPKLLLLDEIDASLHPSMSKIMLEVIEEEFVTKNNINVILVTHSPSTVALAPENSIYVMIKEGEERIIKSNNKEALNILTEGFASLTTDETNLKVSYNISKSSDCVLLTEGITDRIILESAWNKIEKSAPRFDLQDCFDASFLRNLFSRGEIFANYPNKTFVALFDFDKEGYEAWDSFKNYDTLEDNPKLGLLKKHKSQNAYVMLLPVPNNDIQNQVIYSGNITFKDRSHMPIELLFHDVEILKDKFINESQVGGGNLIKFFGDKVSFATKIKEQCDENDLSNIKQIFAALKTIFK